MLSARRPQSSLQQAGAATIRSLMTEAPKEAPIGRAFHRPMHVAYDEAIKEQELKFLEDVFRNVDKDGSGKVSAREFAECMKNEQAFQIFHSRFGLQPHDTPRVFRALDDDCSGDISIEEWLTTCRLLMTVVKEGDVITNWRIHELKERLHKMEDVKTPANRLQSKTMTATPRASKQTPRGNAGSKATSTAKSMLMGGQIGK